MAHFLNFRQFLLYILSLISYILSLISYLLPACPNTTAFELVGECEFEHKTSPKECGNCRATADEVDTVYLPLPLF